MEVAYSKTFDTMIPKKYLKMLEALMLGKKFGTFSLIIQDGKIVGCDILEKNR